MVDTAQKRRSATRAFCFLPYAIHPEPDGTIDAADRYQVVDIYAGLAESSSSSSVSSSSSSSLSSSSSSLSSSSSSSISSSSSSISSSSSSVSSSSSSSLSSSSSSISSSSSSLSSSSSSSLSSSSSSISSSSSSLSSSSSSISSSSSSSSTTILIYTRGDEVSLPSNNDNDLETYFSDQNYIDVSIDNTNGVSQTADNATPYSIFLFKVKNSSQENISITVKCKSNKAPSDSTMYLQIFNRTSNLWETLDSDNSALANVVFTLTGSISSNLGDYFDVDFWISFRTYQQVV